MDFFELQDRAKRKTGYLLFLFCLAILGLIFGTYFLMQFSLILVQEEISMDSFDSLNVWNSEVFVLSALGILGLVGLTSYIKTSRLKSGGSVVAEDLGGRLVDPGTQDFKLRQLLNVVEEMAIASGTPVPQVYILEEEKGINAFAAGYHPGNAVIGITRGALDAFDRDELQGVIGHEFSHILNGDMRLNIKLIGYLSGILVLTVIGRIMTRIGFYSRGGRGKNNAAVLGFVGIGLLVMGYIGLLIGRIIKSAVSRQREYLADASSIQFTRNPTGIYNALKKIKAHSEGTILETPKAEEASHLLFGVGIKSGFGNLFSTHPSLDQRLVVIAKVSSSVMQDSNFNPSFNPSRQFHKYQKETKKELTPEERFLGGTILAGANIGIQTRKGVNESSGSVGSMGGLLSNAGVLDSNHIHYAEELIDSIPDSIKNSARETYGARAVVYCLLLDRKNKSILNRQWKNLEKSADLGVFKEVKNLANEIFKLPTRTRLPLIEITLPALSSLTVGQYRIFQKNLERTIDIDGKMDIGEWALYRILIHHLSGKIEGRKPARENSSLHLSSSRNAIERVLSVLTERTGSIEKRISAFEKAKEILILQGIQYKVGLPLDSLHKELEILEGLRPQDKKKFLSACESIITFDSIVNEEEVEVFRALADSLNCPVPPLIPNTN